jgi:poly-gamma-glutamate synthesis protein (capsule biosynthesis protein)
MEKSKVIIVAIICLAAAGAALVWAQNRSGGAENENAGAGKSEIAPDGAPAVENQLLAEKAQNKPVKLLAFGDLLLDRYIKLYIDRNSPEYPFADIKDALAGNDLVLANLEGSFTDFAPRQLDPNNTSFTFDPKLAATLKSSGFNLVSLANNHVQDFGKDGFAQSQAYLDGAGIEHFGDFYNEGPALAKDINGLKIAFIGYNEFGKPSIEPTIAKIKEAALRADYIVVYAHWGAEYQTDPWPGSQEKGRRFIDAGADAVLGSHPHVVQPIEIYKGKPIFYSLGNFVFDQIFSDQVRHGLGVRLILGKDKAECELFSTEMKNFQVSLSSEKKKGEVLSWLAKNSVASESVKTQIKAGKFIVR